MYPAYKLRDVLAEYSIVFFTLLAEGYRLQSQDLLMQAYIALTPSMTEQNRKEFIRQLEYASKDLSDILKPNTDGSSPEELKRMFG